MKTKETGPLENSAGNAADNGADHPVHPQGITCVTRQAKA
jgi:hypothetical protein